MVYLKGNYVLLLRRFVVFSRNFIGDAVQPLFRIRPMVRSTAVAIVSFHLTLATSAFAQITTAAGVGLALQRSTGLWSSVTRFEPAFRFDNRWGSLTTELSAAAGSQGLRIDDGRSTALFSPAPIGPVRFATAVQMERMAVGGHARLTGTLETAISMAVGQSGGWLGLATARSSGADSAVIEPLLRVGFWRRLASVTVTVSGESHNTRLGGRPSTVRQFTYADSVQNDTIRGGWTRVLRTGERVDSAVASRHVRWSDVQARITWSAARLSLDGRVGVRPKLDFSPTTLWGRIYATMALAPRLSLVAAGGSEAAKVWIGAPSQRFVSLGLRVAPAALVRPLPSPHVRPTVARFAVTRVDSGTYLVTLRVPEARVVELSGDFNGWHPISLRQARPDVWEAAIALVPGTYHVNVRVNGDRWMAPPGLTAASDDFNGTVGLLIVP